MLVLAFSKHPSILQKVINHDALVWGESESIHCASIANACQGSKLSSILYTNMTERRQLELAEAQASSLVWLSAGSSGCSGNSVGLSGPGFDC